MGSSSVRFPSLGHNYNKKIPYFTDFGVLQPTPLKPRQWNFGGQTWDCLPTPNFVKIAQGDSSLRDNFFFTKNSKFLWFWATYAHNFIPIMLKFCLREWTKESLSDKKFSQNRSGDSGHGLPVLHCLGRDAYWLLVFGINFPQRGTMVHPLKQFFLQNLA